MHAMANNLASFAIHVDDVDRARRFYEAVFGWVFEPWGPPGFYLIHTGDEADPGIQGLMHKRQVPRTGTGLNGFEPTFAVDDLDAIIAAVEANGGRITMPKAPIPTVGVLIRFDDTEGNNVGAMAYEAAPVTR
ncbi:MAG: VOC family protein [Proteobacteria bacterium]|nr:VOC family protein [Pseudomonadota bacterium]